MISILEIHNKLKLNSENGLFIRNTLPETSNSTIQELYEGDFTTYKSNFKVEYALKKLQPHSFFLFNNEPLLLFFDFSEKNNKESLKKLSRDVWNFNKSALVFVNESSQLNIYNGFQYKRESGLLHVLETIKTLRDGEKLENYSYWKIVTAELWNERDKDFEKKSRVDTKLLGNIRTTREILIDKNAKNRLLENYANRIIGRLIFVRYLIDRNVNLDYQGKGKELLTKDHLPELIVQKDNLFDFFEYLLKKFNGDILPLNGEQDAVNQSHLDILSRLFKGEDIKSHQRSLFNVFNFDFIPIELVSNIYETFLGEKQSSEKAFYTPPFLVDYVLEQTVKPFIAKQQDSKRISCKTADLTCGSGIFLCETLRTIINRYIELANPDKSSKEFKTKIKQLLKDNLFGNDLNQEAIEIAKFSLYITLLDYFVDPKDIEDFEFPNISNNFHNRDIFDEHLNNIFGKDKPIEPDFIIGNPPWGKIEGSRYLEYCKEREQEENRIKKELWIKENKAINDYKPVEIKISNKEFAQAYLLRLSDFSTPNTVCHVVVTSKLLYNLQAHKFRNYFLENYLVNEVLEISSVRHHIFSNAVGPAAILKYKYGFGTDSKDNLIEYISLKPNPYLAIFKTILIEKYDYKEVIQKELIENDWLWKVLVYGHILDFRFIQKLRDHNKFPITIGRLIDDDDKDNKDRQLFASTGIKIGNKSKPNSVSQYKGMPFIETDVKRTKRPSDLQRFYIHFDKKNIWIEDDADGIRNEKVFKFPPALLIKIGFTPEFKLVSSITNIECVFTNSIYAIKSKARDNQILENLLGLINSDLMAFYMVMCGSSIGVEREQLINKELFPFPVIKDDNIGSQAKHLIKLKDQIEFHKKSSIFNDIKISQYEEQFIIKEAKLNQLIFNLYNLSNTEKDLISYAQEITIPVLQARNKKYNEIYRNKRFSKPYKKLSDTEITDYINIFKEHFSKFHKGGANGYFNVRIFKSENILAIEFYIDDKQHKDEWQENETSMELLAGLGFQKISSDLFIQKDVKTLNQNSFSVLKINQYKYWHKAIARLDVIEFSEAMIQSQKQVSNG